MKDAPNASARTEDFEFAALQEARNYRQSVLDSFAEFLHGRVLEVGAGIGQITDELLKNPRITKLVSVEPDARFFVKLQARHPGHEVLPGTVAALPAGGAWDAILSINVLEHIEDDRGELARYRRLLAGQRGRLCLFVPARPEIYAPIDQDFGHFRRYTRAELKQKLTGAGFEIEELHYYNFAGYFAWWLSFCLLKRRGFDAASVRLFDRAIFPLVRVLEAKVCRPPFGQSLLAIARAKD